jgi:hypothetical protein
VRWACRNYGIKDADLELLIFLDCQGFFSKTDFKEGNYIYSWNPNKFQRLLNGDWIAVWRHGYKKNGEGSLYKLSLKASILIAKMYKILTKEETIPTGATQNVIKSNAYTDNVLKRAINIINNDK